ncbi:MAG: asparagine synthetase B [Dehalococcoidia bacterium]
MSGIMALVSLDGRPIPSDLPRAQLAAIAHRGEWEPRLWEGPGIALGHVNLPRTPEAEREFLPASDSSERYWITWDGRLDNRDELAPKLGYDAVERAQKTDADYVLDAYIKWKDECVHQLLGDWAIVIWDNQERKLFCAKDPIGWRQLYYAEHEGLLAVGSEPQQFFANGWLAPEANIEFVLKTLAQALVSPNISCWSGISELRGGQALQLSSEQHDVSSHMPYPAIRERNYRDPETYVDEFEDLVLRATKARLRSNVPVGCSLSGGLDSSYTTAIANKVQPGLQSFTVFVPNTKALDERNYARLVAQEVGSELVETDVSDCWYLSSQWLPDTTLDQPILPGAGPSLRKLAHDVVNAGVGVLIGGEGGDEWLGGSWSPASYPAIASAIWAGRFRLAGRFANGPRFGAKAIATSVLDGFSPKPVKAAIQPFRRQQSITFRPFIRSERDWIPLAAVGFARPWDLEGRAKGAFAIYRQVVANEVGWRDRHVFSGLGIENRSPFNDWRVVELLASTPDWAKQFSGQYRAILRTALQREGLNAVGSRTTKGTYAELSRPGILERELYRTTLGLTKISELESVRTSVIEGEFQRWKRSNEAANGDVFRLATTGLWLHQLNSVARVTRARGRNSKGEGGDGDAKEVRGSQVLESGRPSR